MLILVSLIVGPILGSFIDVLANRSPKGRSFCPECKHTLQWTDLFPLLSYLYLKGKCRYCHKQISKDSLWVELAMIVVVALVLWQPLQQMPDLYWALDISFRLFVITILATFVVTDLKTGLIPNRISYPAIMIALIYVLVLHGIRGAWVEYLMALGSAAGASFLFACLIWGTRGKGMGWGDVKYVFFLGLVLGFPNILVGLFLSFLSGAVISVGLITFGKKHFGQTIPFGPFLSLGSFIAFIWAVPIIEWYLGLARP